ncbi:cystine/glutamate transporter-like [Diadema antillarum]|uniref:cystine/glutamate transporter-like n=1 Tax=Diadema antillarum TaxID=105358 RepID=UPI003A878BF1
MAWLMNYCRSRRNRRETDDDVSNSSDDKVAIPRHLGLMECIWHTVGTVIGTGIFISPSGILRGTGGSVGVAFIFWVVCAIYALLGTLIYTELALMFKKSGGELAFMLEGWGRAVGFLKLWIIVVVTSSSSTIQSITIGQYLLASFYQCSDPPVLAIQLVGALMILSILAINCVNVRLSSRFAAFFSVTKVFGLLIVIATGMYNLAKGHSENLQNAFDTKDLDMKFLPIAFYSGSYAFGGWDTIVSLTEEIERPERNIPLSLIVSMTAITCIYLMANVAYLTLLSPQQIIDSDAVAADYSVLALGQWSWLIWLFVAISALGALNSGTLKRGRQVFAAAREGLFPEIMSMISVTRRTPVPAVLAFTICFVYLVEIDVIKLIQHVAFVEIIFDTMTVAVLPYYRWKQPDAERPFRCPLVAVVIYMACQLFISGMALYLDPIKKIIGLVLALSGLPFYFAFFSRRYRIKKLDPYTAKLTRFLQKVFYVVHQEKKTF